MLSDEQLQCDKASTELNSILCSVEVAVLLERRRRKAQKSPGHNLNGEDKEACSSVLSPIRVGRADY